MPKHDDMSRVRSVALVGAESEEFSVDREDVCLYFVDSLRSVPSVHSAVQCVPVEFEEYFM